MFTEQSHALANDNSIQFKIKRYRYQCYEKCLQNVTVISQKREVKWIAKALDSKYAVMYHLRFLVNQIRNLVQSNIDSMNQLNQLIKWSAIVAHVILQ